MINVDEQLYRWSGEEKLQEIDKTLETLFNNIFITNINLNDIIIKVCVLNDLYSTQIFDTFSMARHIYGLNIDEDLEKGNFDLIDKIAQCKIGDKTRNFYSFATKYCSHHYPEKFAIYDSYVAYALNHFNKKDPFHKFKKSDLKNYFVFMETITAFIKKNSLFKYSLKEIDKFLWTCGKELKNKN